MPLPHAPLALAKPAVRAIAVLSLTLAAAQAHAQSAAIPLMTVPNQALAEAGSRAIAEQILNEAYASGLARTQDALDLTPGQTKRWNEFAVALAESMAKPGGPRIDAGLDPLARAQMRLERERLTFERERRVTLAMERLYKVLTPDQRDHLNEAIDTLGQLSVTAVAAPQPSAYY